MHCMYCRLHGRHKIYMYTLLGHLRLRDTAFHRIRMLEALLEKQPLTLCCLMYSRMHTYYTLYFYLKGLNDLFMQTHLTKCGYSPPPKIAIFNQSCFILMVLHGSYTYFWGPIKEFYKDFSPSIEENFTKLW